jgi:hypothetical protein
LYHGPLDTIDMPRATLDAQATTLSATRLETRALPLNAALR